MRHGRISWSVWAPLYCNSQFCPYPPQHFLVHLDNGLWNLYCQVLSPLGLGQIYIYTISFNKRPIMWNPEVLSLEAILWGCHGRSVAQGNCRKGSHGYFECNMAVLHHQSPYHWPLVEYASSARTQSLLQSSGGESFVDLLWFSLRRTQNLRLHRRTWALSNDFLYVNVWMCVHKHARHSVFAATLREWL